VIKVLIQEKAVSFLTFTIAVLAGISLVSSSGFVLDEYREHDVIVSVMGDVMALDAISHELLFAQRERGAIQWQKAYTRTQGHLANLKEAPASDLVKQIKRELGEMEPLFLRFVNERETMSSEKSEAQKNVELFLVGQLRTRLATVVKIVQVWHENSSKRAQMFFVMHNVLIMVLALLSVLVFVVWGSLLRRHFILPILRFKQAFVEMAAGDFSRRIENSGNPELDEVVVAFNALADKLEQKQP
jgi:methyl-accepting chemotaxis protein